MPRNILTRAERNAIDTAIQHFAEHRLLFQGLAESLRDRLQEDSELAPFIHFIKSRVKGEDRLRHKLEKKALKQPRGSRPLITAANVFTRINDLAGIRLIHLHTNQLKSMEPEIQRILAAEKWKIVKGPIANCWDKEYETLFEKFGIETTKRESLYSSVHYILQANKRTRVTIELQVRTLMEEVWGEVSHRVGYEDELVDEIVDQQLKVLARLTSGSTRLVDCIFNTYEARRTSVEGQD